MITEFRGGQWFDGERFVPRSMWVRDGVFVEPTSGGNVVDLADGFVVPPYGEGHAHWLEAALVDVYIQENLRAGIFYVKDQSTPPIVHDRIRPLVNTPTSVDYVAAHQGFTGPAAHPAELVDQLAAFGVLPREWAATHGEGDALFVVTSEREIDAAWGRLEATPPDFVKVFLAHSDEYERRLTDPAQTPKGRGIDPALVAPIVERAHRAGYRVSAHIENAHDFHVAVAAGVDEIAHMPFVEAENLESYRLAQADIESGSRVIATTLDHLVGAGPEEPRVSLQRENLQRLRAAGWTIVIGTDLFRKTARFEAELIGRLGLMTSQELLRAWCIDTPRSIFPARKIGALEIGYEASFLVLEGDPLKDLAALHVIRQRVKRGVPVEPADAQFPVMD